MNRSTKIINSNRQGNFTYSSFPFWHHSEPNVDIWNKHWKCACHAIARTLHFHCSALLLLLTHTTVSIDFPFNYKWIERNWRHRKFSVKNIPRNCKDITIQLESLRGSFSSLGKKGSNDGGTKPPIYFGCWKRLQNADGKGISKSRRCPQRLGLTVDGIM